MTPTNHVKYVLRQENRASAATAGMHHAPYTCHSRAAICHTKGSLVEGGCQQQFAVARRAFLRAIVCAGALATVPGGIDSRVAGAVSRPIVGAIRWDAWYRPGNVENAAVASALEPPSYHFRLPWFAKISPSGTVRIEGGHQEIMDREILAAHSAGLKYWAFDYYGSGDPMSVALELYLSSREKDKVNFCLMISANRLGSVRSFRDIIDRQVTYMAHPSHQSVLNGRPLVFLGFLSESTIRTHWDGNIRKLRRAVDYLRESAARRAGRDPYIALMTSDPVGSLQYLDLLELDALSAYAVRSAVRHAPYSNLASRAKQFWEICAATGKQVIPTVMTGWDRRPRIEHPVPWEHWQKPRVGMDSYYQTATPSEIADHLATCLKWLSTHQRAAPAQAAIIYAWDEDDEGGWLIPTYNGTPLGDSSRLRAVQRVLM
jgi:hypothetical protein